MSGTAQLGKIRSFWPIFTFPRLSFDRLLFNTNSYKQNKVVSNTVERLNRYLYVCEEPHDSLVCSMIDDVGNSREKYNMRDNGCSGQLWFLFRSPAEGFRPFPRVHTRLACPEIAMSLFAPQALPLYSARVDIDIAGCCLWSWLVGPKVTPREIVDDSLEFSILQNIFSIYVASASLA